MPTPVADLSTEATPEVSVPTTPATTPTAHAVRLAKRYKRRHSRRRMQRAARIFAGNMTLGDKIATYPDKGWALMILLGTMLMAYALGCATLLVVEYYVGAVVTAVSR